MVATVEKQADPKWQAVKPRLAKSSLVSLIRRGSLDMGTLYSSQHCDSSLWLGVPNVCSPDSGTFA